MEMIGSLIIAGIIVVFVLQMNKSRKKKEAMDIKGGRAADNKVKVSRELISDEGIRKKKVRELKDRSRKARKAGDASGGLEEELRRAAKGGTLKISREIPETGYCILNGVKRKLSDLKDY